MAMREQDLEVIRAWAQSHVPEEAAEKVRVRAEIDRHQVTIFEGFRASPEGEFSETTVARLRYTASMELWSLWWADRAGDFKPYAEHLKPAERVSTLLAAIDEDAHGLFWG